MFLHAPFSQALLQRFVALGTECAEYLMVAKASEGTLLTSSHYFSSVLILCCLSDSLSSSPVAALATANARIASLEAELSASQRLMMLRPLLEQTLRSRRNLRLVRRRKLKKL
jgi:hypothetical protein